MRKRFKKYFLNLEFINYLYTGVFGTVVDFVSFGFLIFYQHSVLTSQWLAALFGFTVAHL